MKKQIIKNLQLALGIGFGVAIHQYFLMPDSPFDFFRVMVIALFTFVVSSIGTLIKAKMQAAN